MSPAAAGAPDAPAPFVVLSSQHDAEAAYHLLSEKRTSKAFLLLDPSDPSLTLQLVRSMLIYNYGIAHRCCTASEAQNPNLGSFCLQIFQYAESLMPAGCANNLLFKLVLTRNLMMLSCRLGMSLCEHYKETLDPIVAGILEPPQPGLPDSGGHDKAPAA